MPQSSPSRRASLRTFICGLAGVGFGGALGAVGTRRAARAAADPAPIVGVWLVSTPAGRRCFYVFHGDGILAHAGPPVRPTDNPADPEHALEYTTGGRGTWRRTDFNQYSYFEHDIDFDATGTPMAFDQVAGTVTYDPSTDRWTGDVTLQETDLDGTPTGATLRLEMTARRVGFRP